MRFFVRFWLGFFLLKNLSVTLCAGGVPAEISRIQALPDRLLISGQCDRLPAEILERPLLTGQAGTVPLTKKGAFQVSVPRFDGLRDRLYSGFELRSLGVGAGEVHYVDQWTLPAVNWDPYPTPASKKGLQVQMLDDALALGVKHGALNFSLGAMMAAQPGPDDFSWASGGRTFYFRRAAVEGTDAQVKKLSDAGVNVTLIVLNYRTGHPAVDAVTVHPEYDAACPNNLSQFNVVTEEGRAWLQAAMEFFAHRYAEAGYPHGRVAGYIIGNEVNSHWWWANRGHVSLETFADEYAQIVRLLHAAVRKYSATARVYVSLEHHWNIRYPAGDETQSFPARAFLERFNGTIQRGGDFDWHVAFHPYPENLFEPRVWLDKTATLQTNTPRITFRNLEMLPQFLRQPGMLCHGTPRRVILSEQGFHSNPNPKGERFQAAAYAYAWRKVVNLAGVDAFILHRQVDHGGEGGLRLGLWRRDESAAFPAQPTTKKPIYNVFLAADTKEWEKAFAFALPLLGIRDWKDLARAGTPREAGAAPLSNK